MVRSPESKSPRQQIIDQELNRCRHFNGLMSRTCKAGITYDDVGDAGRWPCLHNAHGDEMECPAREWTTLEQAQARAEEIDKHLRLLNERAARNECWHCGRPIERKVQVGRCIYAEPCGCRLGQGRLRTSDA
jgi:hypothetical protein